jgi:mycothiol synthase
MNIVNYSKEYSKETAKICRQSLTCDIMPDYLFKEKTILDPDYRNDLTLIAREGNEIIGFIQGVIRTRQDGKYGYVKLLCVEKDFRRNKTAQRLYKEIEQKFIAEGVKVIRVGESYPNYLTPGVDPFYTEAVCFFERNGFVKFNDTSNLVSDLTHQSFDTQDDEKKLQKENFFVKRAEPNDRDRIIEWLGEVFPGWISEVEEAFKNNPVSLFIAGTAGKLLAFSAYETNNKGTGWFGPMGTDAEARGKGIGAVLLKKCLNALKEEGFVKAIIPWVGPIPFYMYNANAKVNRIFWRYEKKLS